jgi:hypothetical protein
LKPTLKALLAACFGIGVNGGIFMIKLDDIGGIVFSFTLYIEWCCCWDHARVVGASRCLAMKVLSS